MRRLLVKNIGQHFLFVIRSFPSFALFTFRLSLNAAPLKPRVMEKKRGRVGVRPLTDTRACSVQTRCRVVLISPFFLPCYREADPDQSWSRRSPVRLRRSSSSSGAARSGSLHPGPMNWPRCPGTSTPDTG